ncbi:hypothetical protein EON67_10050, partial [archaeon]
KSRTAIVLRNGRLQLQHNSIGDDVPIVAVFKAMGVTSDQEIASLVGPEPEILDALSASIEDAATLGIFSQQQALEYIGEKVKAKRTLGRSHLSKPDEGRNALAQMVLSHVPGSSACTSLLPPPRSPNFSCRLFHAMCTLCVCGCVGVGVCVLQWCAGTSGPRLCTWRTWCAASCLHPWAA